MAEKPTQHLETPPDPEEDELDDLDDVLDEFQPRTSAQQPPTSTTTTTTTSTAAPSASGPGRPSKADNGHSAVDPGGEDLEHQLQAGMKGLVEELDANPEMQKQFEQMMQDLIAAGAAGSDPEAGKHLREAAETVSTPGGHPPTADGEGKAHKARSAGGGSSGSGGGGGGSDAFGETIRRTMERMQQSDSTATASASQKSESAGSEEEMLAQMMRELQAGGGAGGEGGEEDFNKMLMSMMSQLTNKEILYEPMKELHDKFPAWMEKHAQNTSKEELDRYKEQQRLVGEIVGRFERSGYSDENEEDRGYIVERMQKMQAQGSPPPDLVGDMSAAQEALGDLDAGCPTQ